MVNQSINRYKYLNGWIKIGIILCTFNKMFFVVVLVPEECIAYESSYHVDKGKL